MSKREFQLVDDKSKKFWIIELAGSSHTVHYGRIGTNGQTKTKEFDTAKEAKASHDKLIAEKVKKGYEEVGGTGTATTSTGTKAAAKTKKKTKTKTKKAAGKTKKTTGKKKTAKTATKQSTAKKPTANKAATTATSPKETAAPDEQWTRREFEFRDGNSEKFWHIEITEISRITADGDETRPAHRVTFGRIGTDGQLRDKEFDTVADARADAEKLIKQKVKKGYVETTSGATASAAPARAKSSTGKSRKEAKAKTATGTGSTATGDGSAPAPTPTATSTAVSLSTDTVLHLTPADRAFATWEPHDPPARPEPEPFDIEACFKRLKKAGRYQDWDKIDIPDVMTPEEGEFWIRALTVKRDWNDKFETIRTRIEKTPCDGDLSAHEIATLLVDAASGRSPLARAIAPIVALIGPMATAELVLDDAVGRALSATSWRVNPGIEVRRHALAWLTAAEKKKLARQIRPAVKPGNWPAGSYETPVIGFYMAAGIGMHKEVAAVVSSWADDLYTNQEEYWAESYQHPQLMVLGLGSPGEVEAEARRLRLRMRDPEHVRGWIACTGVNALDVVAESVKSVGNKDEASALAEAFASIVEAPEAAGPMLYIRHNSKAPKVAKEWLETHVGCAIAGLVPVASGRGKLADQAIQQLRTFKRMGHGDRIAEAATDANAERVTSEVVDHEETIADPFPAGGGPEWLQEAVADAENLKKTKLPDWLTVAELPQAVVGENSLNQPQLAALVKALQKSTWEEPHPLVRGLREHGDRTSLDNLAWHIFEAWLGEGAPSKEKWAMMAIGFFGGDPCALKLTPLVRQWPGESQHKRAVLGLECLRGIGSDTALMMLNGVAQKLKFKGLKQAAKDYMEQIASDRGMTRAELEDLIVPDCDLDERGTREFDFGPRKFHFVLGGDLKPMVKDEAGKLKANLPKPGKKDDEAKANAAVAEWKLLKKVVKDAAKIQAVRLEQAMVTGRRWPVDRFEELIVRHPLMVNLARQLVWAAIDAKGKRVATFRVTDEQDYADPSDEPLALGDRKAKEVEIVHPLHLTDADKQAWGEVLADYEIIPPFPQIGRPVNALEKGEEKATDIRRAEGVMIPAVSLVSTLEKFGWLRGTPQDAGIFSEHVKQFHAANVTAVIQYPGVPVGYMVDWEDQQVEGCFFLPGIYNADDWWNDHKTKRLKLGTVDPVVISEVINDLQTLISKGRK